MVEIGTTELKPLEAIKQNIRNLPKAASLTAFLSILDLFTFFKTAESNKPWEPERP